jgi:hypothetical protein
MPTFELTAPDGKSYDIEAESIEMAAKAVEHAFGGRQPQAEPELTPERAGGLAARTGVQAAPGMGVRPPGNGL